MKPSDVAVTVYMLDGVIKFHAQVGLKGMKIKRKNNGMGMMDEEVKKSLQDALTEAIRNWEIGVDNV